MNVLFDWNPLIKYLFWMFCVFEMCDLVLIRIESYVVAHHFLGKTLYLLEWLQISFMRLHRSDICLYAKIYM